MDWQRNFSVGTDVGDIESYGSPYNEYSYIRPYINVGFGWYPNLRTNWSINFRSYYEERFYSNVDNKDNYNIDFSSQFNFYLSPELRFYANAQFDYLRIHGEFNNVRRNNNFLNFGVNYYLR